MTERERQEKNLKNLASLVEDVASHPFGIIRGAAITIERLKNKLREADNTVGLLENEITLLKSELRIANGRGENELFTLRYELCKLREHVAETCMTSSQPPTITITFPEAASPFSQENFDLIFRGADDE